MKLRVIRVGRGGCAWADDAVNDYARRMRRWGGVEDVAVKKAPFKGDAAHVKLQEGERTLRKVGPRDRLIVLDERGDDLDVPGFVDLLRKARGQGPTHLSFALGGAYGHDPAVRSRAHQVIRLSALVLNHEVARVVLYEQLYRAHTVLHGLPYHH